MGSPTRPGGALDSSLDFRLCFPWLHAPERCIAFPCDESGTVEVDSLSDLDRMLYQSARAMLGHYYAAPMVRRANGMFASERSRGGR